MLSDGTSLFCYSIEENRDGKGNEMLVVSNVNVSLQGKEGKEVLGKKRAVHRYSIIFPRLGDRNN